MKRFPNTFVIVFFVILLCAVATWVVPGGQYVTGEDGQLRFETVESAPQTWQVFTALYDGFRLQAGIIVIVLVFGGAFWIVNQTHAVSQGIRSFLDWSCRLERYGWLKKVGVNNLVICAVILLFSFFGGVFGMSEDCIPFVAIIVPMAISMGYDSIVGLLMVYVAAHVGFAGAFLNPFTIGIAQGMADLPLFSGLGYRLFCWAVLTVLLMVVTLLYASKVRKCPTSSVMYCLDETWRNNCKDETSLSDLQQDKKGHPFPAWVVFVLTTLALIAFSVVYAPSCSLNFGNRQFETPWLLWVIMAMFVACGETSLRKSVNSFVLCLMGFTILYLLVGVLCFGWYLAEISALFLAMGLLCGIAAGFGPNRLVSEFLAGAKDIFSAALVIGLASGIIVILKNGHIIDTMLHSMVVKLDGSGQTLSLTLMYGIQSVINLFIPSASAKAAITVPIMAPFSDLIGLSRQSMVLAFQFGDGFTNIITPCSGVLMAALGMARIPYVQWLKWVWKFVLLLMAVGFLLLLFTVLVPLEGF